MVRGTRCKVEQMGRKGSEERRGWGEGRGSELRHSEKKGGKRVVGKR